MNPALSMNRQDSGRKSGVKQKTIKEPVILEGVGLQTGNPVKLTLKPAPADSGINFIRCDLPNSPALNVASVNLEPRLLPDRRTTLGMGPLQIQTIEHLMAALSGLSIDNIVIELDNVELPGLDGSARDFLRALKSSGIVEQNAPKKILKIEDVVWCAGKDNMLAVFPDDDFKISYTLSYEDRTIGTRFFTIVLNDKNFETEIAPARTFCLEAEALKLLKSGLGKGANYENTLVIGKDGPVRNALRFPDEPVRHKILDLIGDLYLLGSGIKGHVVAIKSGHALNMELVQKLKEKI